MIERLSKIIVLECISFELDKDNEYKILRVYGYVVGNVYCHDQLCMGGQTSGRTERS